MITRIEIDGFKSFRHFAVDLRPLQVLIGRNGVGKSNLFDAIVLLASLADQSLYDVFSDSRGEIAELFTYPSSSLSDGQHDADGTTMTRRMQFAVELLIGRDVTDELGQKASVSTTRLRYELTIESRFENGFERLQIAHEALLPITGKDDIWVKNHIERDHQPRWVVRSKGRRGLYLSTERGENGQLTINVHQDGRSGRVQGISSDRFERTVLSTINTVEYPTAYAVKRELMNWRFLQLNPALLRQPVDVRLSHLRTQLEPDASNLAAVLWRISQTDEFILTDISSDMAHLVPGFLDASIRVLAERKELLIEARMTDDAVYSSRVLSDGTLRLLTLVTLKHDPLHQGLLCFEEPENGVHPSRLKDIVEVLRYLATNLNQPDETDGALRQILVNTHSPKFAAQVSIDAGELLFVQMRGSQSRYTHIVPVVWQLISNRQEEAATYHEVKRYMEIDEQKAFIEQLNQQRDTLPT